ncbi:MAG: sulfur carrier protein ThiS [Marinovum sp.]|nr:sulfur carrier protein ThiS [Marinovum sp.]
MKIEINGEPREMEARTISEALDELGLADAKVATALNGDFVPKALRGSQTLRDGDKLEVLAPMQGG